MGGIIVGAIIHLFAVIAQIFSGLVLPCRVCFQRTRGYDICAFWRNHTLILITLAKPADGGQFSQQ